MRLAARLIRALPVLLPGAAAVLGGCFTTLNHPEVAAPAGAATAERWHINLADNCASCHAGDRHIRSVTEYRRRLDQPNRSRRLAYFETYPWWYDNRAFESGRYGYGYLDEPQDPSVPEGEQTRRMPVPYAPAPVSGPVPQLPASGPTRGYGGSTGSVARGAQQTPAAEPSRGSRTADPTPTPTDTTARTRERAPRPQAPQTTPGASGNGRTRG